MTDELIQQVTSGRVRSALVALKSEVEALHAEVEKLKAAKAAKPTKKEG